GGHEIHRSPARLGGRAGEEGLGKRRGEEDPRAAARRCREAGGGGTTADAWARGGEPDAGRGGGFASHAVSARGAGRRAHPGADAGAHRAAAFGRDDRGGTRGLGTGWMDEGRGPAGP